MIKKKSVSESLPAPEVNQTPAVLPLVNNSMVNQQGIVPLDKSIIDLVQKPYISIVEHEPEPAEPNPERKSYTYDPLSAQNFAGFYRRRQNLLPYAVSRSVAENNELLSSILSTRGNQLSNFGHPQVNRQDTGYKFAYRRPSEIHKLPLEAKADLDQRIGNLRDLIYNCGSTKNVPFRNRITFPEFLQHVGRTAPLYGHVPVEIVKDRGSNFHSFRVVDAGTIYKAPYVDLIMQDVNGRMMYGTNDKIYLQLDSDYKKLVELHDKNQDGRIDLARLNRNSFRNNEYAWVQVIHDIPRMAFTDSELIVQNYYPSPAIEYAGYPRPPIDDVVRSLTTHMNAMSHNHLFFLQGRGTKGAMVIHSDQATEDTARRIRQHMQASINSVRNSFRMPVFTVPSSDNIDYVPFETGTRDQEFTYLSENTARTILTAYNMAPEELSAMGYLSRGSVSGQPQTESDNEYKLLVARSAGFKQLLNHTQILMNRIVEIIDPVVSEHCVFKFVGLDGEDPVKEAARLQVEMNTHLTMNGVMASLQKEDLPVGGNIPLNPMFMNLAKENVPLNQLIYSFTGNESSLLDPTLNFIQSGFWFQYQSLYKDLLRSKGRIQHSLTQYTEELKALLLDRE